MGSSGINEGTYACFIKKDGIHFDRFQYCLAIILAVITPSPSYLAFTAAEDDDAMRKKNRVGREHLWCVQDIIEVTMSIIAAATIAYAWLMPPYAFVIDWRLLFNLQWPSFALSRWAH